MSFWHLALAIAVGISFADVTRAVINFAAAYWAVKRSLTRQAQYQKGAKDFAKAVEMAYAEKKLHLLSQSDKLTVQ